MLDSHANRIRGDDIIKGSTQGGCAPSKGLMNRALSEFESPRRQNKAPPCRRAGIGSRGSLSRAGELGSKREKGTREPLINSYWSAGSRRVAGAVAMSSIFLLRVRTRTKARTHTCLKELPPRRVPSHRISQIAIPADSVVSRSVLCRLVLCIYQMPSRATG